MQTAGIAALASPVGAAGVMPAPRLEGKDTPKIALSTGDGGGPGVDSARRIRQLGVEWVLGGGPPMPWDEARLKEQLDRSKSQRPHRGQPHDRGLQQCHLWPARTG